MYIRYIYALNTRKVFSATEDSDTGTAWRSDGRTNTRAMFVFSHVILRARRYHDLDYVLVGLVQEGFGRRWTISQKTFDSIVSTVFVWQIYVLSSLLFFLRVLSYVYLPSTVIDSRN
jgi:hypothetical protein